MAAALKASGLNGVQIAERLGVSRAYAYALLRDPDGSFDRERKRQYAGTCVDCGQSTNGHNGRGSQAAKRCRACSDIASAERQRAREVWKRGTIIAAIQWWADEYGEPPAIPDWNPTKARYMGDEARAEHFEQVHADGMVPTFKTVVRKFGSWNAGIAAAGFEPRRPGGYAENHARRRAVRARAAA